MSIDPAFLAASEAAESWARAIAGASHFVKQGHVDLAASVLRPLWYDRDHEVHGPILTSARDRLADVSDGVIPHPVGTCYPWYTSAHEAILDVGSKLANALNSLCSTADPHKHQARVRRAFSRWGAWLTINAAEMEARIRRERVKLHGHAPTFALSDEDIYILIVLDAHRGNALTFHRLFTESVRMNRAAPRQVKRLSDSTIRARVPVLNTLGLVARPPETQKKGVAITDSGHEALRLARGNTTERQR